MNIDDIYADIIIESSSSEDEKEKEKDDKINSEINIELINKIKNLEEINQSNDLEILNLKRQLELKQEEFDKISKQNDQNKKINEILLKNISCLYKTSLLEIQRKEKEINNLRDEVTNLKKQHHSSGINNRR